MTKAFQVTLTCWINCAINESCLKVLIKWVNRRYPYWATITHQTDNMCRFYADGPPLLLCWQIFPCHVTACHVHIGLSFHCSLSAHDVRWQSCSYDSQISKKKSSNLMGKKFHIFLLYCLLLCLHSETILSLRKIGTAHYFIILPYQLWALVIYFKMD